MNDGARKHTIDPTVAFSTLGCKLNLYETDALATRFREGGYRIVEFGSPADVQVINSCTVTNRADRKSRNLLYRAQRRSGAERSGDVQHPAGAAVGRGPESPLVVLTGCYVDSHRDSLESDGRTFVVPNEQKHAIFDLVEAHRRGEVIEPTGSVFDFPIPSRIFHTRTMLKVQDGCDNFCTFCIIPHVRGRAVSRPAVDVLEAAREAVDMGARELVLTGVNMSRYLSDDVSFSDLVRKLLKVEGDFRLRISSLEPDRLDDSFVELFDDPKMCPHLHLCLQSASERILLAMRRQYTFAQFTEVAERLRRRHPDFNLTTDLIVGFPGETQAEFTQSLTAIEDLGFGHVHTFPYSEREGTRAARMPDRIPERIRTERAAGVRAVAAAVKRRYRESLIGSEQRVLVERVDSGGFGEHYVPVLLKPQQSGHTLSRGPLFQENSFVNVRISGIEDGDDPSLIGGLAAEV